MLLMCLVVLIIICGYITTECFKIAPIMVENDDSSSINSAGIMGEIFKGYFWEAVGGVGRLFQVIGCFSVVEQK